MCAFGCPTSAKQHIGITYLPAPQTAGAIVLTGADVQRIVVEGGRARGVQARLTAPDRAWPGDGGGAFGGGALGEREGRSGHSRVRGERSREALEVRAPRVVLAAGTIHTPPLLARNGLGGASGQLGRNLVLHPATAAFALMDEVVDMARGVPQSFYVDEFASDGIMFEGIAGPPAYVALSLPLTGARHAAAMVNYRHLAQFGLMVSDRSRGSVRLPRCGRRGAGGGVRWGWSTP